jgi:MinD-like ATPase involved in chromosome partitioning or flagellar assembly
MALANVACLLSKAGKSVLVVDWDLEAPGLHKFFENLSPDLKSQILQRPGILDLLCAIEKGASFAWRKAIMHVPLGSSSLDFISAGRRDAGYGTRLQSLRWDLLYEVHDIGQAFENMRNEWKAAYDYVLLDSRTGVTDIGDVCTALLPDMLVTVFIANEQNLEGTKLIVERARTVHARLPRDRTKLTVVPLLGRDESFTEYVLSETWRNRIGAELGFTLNDWLPKELKPQSYFQKIFIPYYSYWSFGENLPVVEREQELSNPTSISAAYARLSSLIDSGLDWSVLETGVNPAEISSLRSRASQAEAKSAELEAVQLKLREANEDKRVSRKGLYWRLSAAGVVAVFVVGLFAVIPFLVRIMSAPVPLAAPPGELISSRAALNEAKRQIEEQRNELTKQIAGLQTQNAELLNQLHKQNLTTQNKLDEIIRRNVK